MSLVVELHDSENVVHQSAGATTGGLLHDGAWALQLPLPRRSVWRAGQYQIDVCPVFGRQISFPITVIAEQAKPDAPNELTKIDSEAYDALPCLMLPDVILSDPDSAIPEVTVGKQAGAAIFRILVGEEFSCESEIAFQDDGMFVPSDVILRLTRDGQKRDDPRLTVEEAIAKYKLRAGRPDRFRSVLRASSVPGKLKLDAIYRKAVIASTVIEVVPRTE